MSPRPRGGGRLGVCCCLAALAGCGGGAERPKLDVIWLQGQLTARLARETGTIVDRMACPTVVPRAARRLECSAAFNGEPDVVVVTLGGPDVRPRAYQARLKYLLRGRLEPAIQRRLAQAGFPVASVDCPGPIPQRRGHVSTCRVEDREGRGTDLRVRQTDDAGHVSFRPAGRHR